MVRSADVCVSGRPLSNKRPVVENVPPSCAGRGLEPSRMFSEMMLQVTNPFGCSWNSTGRFVLKLLRPGFSMTGSLTAVTALGNGGSTTVGVPAHATTTNCAGAVAADRTCSAVTTPVWLPLTTGSGSTKDIDVCPASAVVHPNG